MRHRRETVGLGTLPTEKHTCIVCGRVFPKGQGIVINHGGLTLCFHKSKCASKFLKHLLENTPYGEIGKFVRNVAEFFEERLSREREIRRKKI